MCWSWPRVTLSTRNNPDRSYMAYRAASGLALQARGGVMGGTGRALTRASGAVLGALAVGMTSLWPGVATAQSARVSPVPAAGTPQLAQSGTTEQIRQLVQCGGTMYAVGRFSRISQ